MRPPSNTFAAFAQARLPRLLDLQRRLRDALRRSMAEQSTTSLSRIARDEGGASDTIFGIDVDAEHVLLTFCEQWAHDDAFVLIAEGLPPDGIAFGSGAPAFRLIVDPVDGTRGLMYDKRSAWSLAALAPDRAAATSLRDVAVAAMTELPTTRQHTSDVLWAARRAGAHGERHDLLRDGTPAVRLALAPSSATDLRHGFASFSSFFPGGKELTARIEEDFLAAALGGWNADKAEVYTDQYISSGGQLAELALGRDRFVADLRPLVHRVLGVSSSLCSRPYDVCTALVAQEAGCVVTAADGGELSAPLDVTTNVAFVGYANAALAATLQPLLLRVLRRHGIV